MERGIEQLFLLAVIVLMALIDLTVRWLKRKARRDQPPQVDEEQVFVEENDSELLERTWVKPELPSPTQPSLPASLVPSPAAQRPTQPRTVRPRRRHRVRRWLTHPSDARRGIVLMTVIGRCRGLEAPHLGRD